MRLKHFAIFFIFRITSAVLPVLPLYSYRPQNDKHQADSVSFVGNEKKELFKISNFKMFSEAIGTDFFTGILTYCVTFISIYTILFLPMDILRIIPKVNYESFGLVNRIYHSKLSVCSISSIIMVILIYSSVLLFIFKKENFFKCNNKTKQ
jgi:hypothetical protein